MAPALAAAHLHAESSSGVQVSARPAPTVRAIAHNQLGYQPGLPKVATIVLHPEAPASLIPFHLGAADRSQLAFTGTLTPSRKDTLSDDLVSLADFSTLSLPANDRIEVLGTVGDIFRIAPDVYAEALQATMRSYYGQRCGCKVNLGHVYKRCRNNISYPATSSAPARPLQKHLRDRILRRNHGDRRALLQGHDALVAQMIGAFQQLIDHAHAQGIRIVGATITPDTGSDDYHPAPSNEADRQRVNAWIRIPGHFDGVVDFDRVLADPAQPARHSIPVTTCIPRPPGTPPWPTAFRSPC